VTMKTEKIFKQAGFTLQVIPSVEYGTQLLDWMGTHGLNRLEVRVLGTHFNLPVPGYTELCAPDAGDALQRLKQLVDHGRQCGVRVVPAFGHGDGFVELIKKHPDWRATGHVPHPAGIDLNDNAACFRHEGVRRFYEAAVKTVVQAVHPQELLFWLTENRLHCACPVCSGAAQTNDVYDLTEGYFRSQTEWFHACVATTRAAGQALDMSLWTTQGCRPHLDTLIPSLPPDVLWFYYDGERRGNYNLRRRQQIPPEFTRLLSRGYRLGTQLDWATCGEFLTTPGAIRESCLEAAAAGLEAVAGWIDLYPLNVERERGGAHPVLACAAACCAGPAVMTVAQTMSRAAEGVGHPQPVAQTAGEAWATLDECARMIRLADSYAYWWRGTNIPGAICSRIVRNTPVDEIDQRWADEAWDITIPRLDQSVTQLEQVQAALTAVADSTGYLAALSAQLALVAAWGRFCRSMTWAGIVYHRMGSWDSCHGPWRDDHAELVQVLKRTSDALEQSNALAIDGERLVRGTWSHRHRIDEMRQQLVAALEAAERKATPVASSGDAYPYETA
jgi:hypothetical protein